MTVYILQGRYSQEAIQGMIAKPEDRAEAVTALAKAAGGKMVAYYVTFGDHDFCVIIESTKPHTDTMAALFAAAGAGGITGLTTTVGVTSKEAMKAMRGAKKIQAGFKAAGKNA
jgi:uncharacterized protein with GYD domain